MANIKQRILEALRDYLQGKGYKKFRSELDGMDTPGKVQSGESEKEYRPDMVANHNEAKFMFEVEIADNPDEADLVEKCRVLSEAARKTNGKLNLVVPVENYDKVIQILNTNKLEDIGVLQINMR